MCGSLWDPLMNPDEGSYQLPHIFDYLLSTVATPGGQSFQNPEAAVIVETLKIFVKIKVVY